MKVIIFKKTELQAKYNTVIKKILIIEMFYSQTLPI